MARLAADWSADVRGRLCRTALGQDLTTLDRTPVGELLDRIGDDTVAMLRECADVLAHVHIADTFNHKASSGLRYILNPPGTQARVHQHLNIGQGEVPWDEFFGTLAEVGFDGIMTACVFAWEDKADQSSRFMRSEMQRYVDKYWGAAR